MVERDFQQAGYTFAWKIVDSQRYLLPHRRNRAWGLAAVTGSVEVQNIKTSFPACMDALSSNSQVADSDIFFQNAPEEEFKSKRRELLVKKALETHDGENIYVDCSLSLIHI